MTSGMSTHVCYAAVNVLLENDKWIVLLAETFEAEPGQSRFSNPF